MKLLHFDTRQIFRLIASLRTFPITCCCSVRRAHEELPCEGPHHQDSDLQGLVIPHPMPVTTPETHQMSGEMPSWCQISGSAAMPACGWMQHGRYKMWSNFSQPSATIRGGHSVGITISAQCQCTPADTMRDLIHTEHLDGVTLINIFSWLLKWLRKINSKLFMG